MDEKMLEERLPDISKKLVIYTICRLVFVLCMNSLKVIRIKLVFIQKNITIKIIFCLIDQKETKKEERLFFDIFKLL